MITTTDTPPEGEAEVFGDPLDAIWRRFIGAYLGDATVDRLVVDDVPNLTGTEGGVRF